jgi:integrase
VVREVEAAPPPPVEERTLAQVGESYLRELGTRGRRRPTLGDYESYLRVHLVPFFDGTPLRKIGRAEVEAFMAAKLQAGLAPKSVRNYLGLLHSLFEYAERRDWAHGNPCRLVDRPGEEEADSDIRFLSDEELDALLRAVPETGLGRLDRVLYLTAAMTGLRQAELLGLRWRDVDGRPRGCGCGRASCGASSASPSRNAQAAPFRWRTGLPANSTATSKGRSSRRITIWSLATRAPAGRWRDGRR